MKIPGEIYNELKYISPLLADIENKNTFSVPEGYFNTLPMEVYKKINLNSASNLFVPQNYFENLSNTILNKIKDLNDNAAKELRELSPMLYSVQNENVFTVPIHYFENTTEEILNKVSPKLPSKVLTINSRSVWKYAAAAIMAGIIGVSSLLVFNKSQQLSVNDETSYMQAVSQYRNEQQINNGISTLSEDEIIKYLEKNSNDADNEVLNSSIEERGLPEQTDYLQDDKTLDTYLDGIDKKNAQN
ncbi:MAG: hypothetical protein M3004_11830 [Bacteroidota bacterium]|nr:hypothetical protein [Bacteroidota bacterium]